MIAEKERKIAEQESIAATYLGLTTHVLKLQQNDLISSKVIFQKLLTILELETSTGDQRHQEKQNPNFHDFVFRKCTSATSISKTSKIALVASYVEDTMTYTFICFYNRGKEF